MVGDPGVAIGIEDIRLLEKSELWSSAPKYEVRFVG